MMNIRRIMFCLLLVPGLIIGVSSCKDDDDDDDDKKYAQKIEGTYTGTLEIKGQTVAQDVKITVEKVSDTKVNLKMNQTVMELPINITKCESEVLYANDKYTINAGTTVTLPKEAVEGLLGVEIPMPGTTLDVPITVIGEFNKSNEAQINIGLVNFMDQSVFLNVVFKGKK